MKEFTVGSLFAGVGGICLGFKNASTEESCYKLLWANEIDEYACATYRNNFSHELLQGDIKKVLRPQIIDEEIEDYKVLVDKSEGALKERLLKQYEELQENRDTEFEYYTKLHEIILSQPVDVLNGGFPCQAFSIAGEQKGFADERGNLFLNIVDLIEQLGEKFYKPRVLFLENVKNLQAHDGGRTYKVIKSRLESCGYTIYEKVLNTMYFSELPQNRERIYIIGFLNYEDAQNFDLFLPEKICSFRKERSTQEREKEVKSVIDYQSSFRELGKYYYTRERYPHYFATEEEFELSGKDTKINLDEQINEKYQFYQCRRGMYVRKNKSDVCPTLTANMGTGGHNVPLIRVDDGIRKLTPAETFKLQGFPVGKGYELPTNYGDRRYPESQLYKQAGNAVSVPVITFLAKEILKILEKN